MQTPGGSRRGRWAWAAAGGVLLVLGVTGSILLRRGPQPVAPTAGHALPLSAPAADVPAPEQELRALLDRLPRDADAHRTLARYLFEQDRPFEALWHFRAAQELNPSDMDAPVAVARCLIQADLAARAQALLRSRLSQGPADGESRLAMAEAALAVARPNQALDAFTGGDKQRSDRRGVLASSAPAQRLQGDARFAAGDTIGAAAAYRRAVALEPEGAAGYDRQGRMALAAGAWEAARTAYQAAREREPEGVGYAYRLGEAYWGAGEREAAERLWAEVAAAAPGHGPVRLALGRAHRSRKEWEPAAVHLRAAVQSGSAPEEAQLELARVMEAMGRRSSALYQRGVYFLQTDRPHQALALYQKMAAADPTSPKAALMVSFCFMQLQQYQPAVQAAERALRAHPEHPDLRQRIAMLHLLTGNRPAAAQLCQEWLKLSPEAAEPHRLLGRVAFDNARTAEAVRYYEKAAALDATKGDTFLEYGKVLMAAGTPDRLRRAEAALRRAVERQPDRADHRLHLGVALERQGKPDEARRAFLRAIDLDRKLAPAAGALVRVANALQQPWQARFFGELVPLLHARQREDGALWRDVRLRPRDAEAHERLARFLIEGGDLRRARHQLEQVVELDPSRSAASQRLAVVRRLLVLQEP